MAKKKETEKVRVDIDLLREVLKKRKITLKDVCLRLGLADNHLTIIKNRHDGYMDVIRYNLICDLYGLDNKQFILQDKATPEQNNSNNLSCNFEKYLQVIIDNQKKIIELLQVRERQNIQLTAQEDIVLILQQMLRHGACIEEQFKQKAKQAGYSIDLVNYAIDFVECKRDVVNGKVWLKKK